MKRPLVWVAVSILTAVIGTVTGYEWCLPIYIVGLVSITFFEYWHNGSERVLVKALKNCVPRIIILAMICLGMFLYATYTVSFHNNSLINELNSEIYITGRVDNISVKEYGATVLLKDCKVNAVEDITVLVGIYDEKGQLLESGDIIGLTGEVSVIEGPRNDGEFDVKQYYNSLSIFYRINTENIVLIKNVSGVQKILNELKKKLNYVFELVADPKDAGVLKAVVLGDKDYIDEDIYELYKDNGIAHILAISGLHISFIGLLIYRFFKRVLSGYIAPFAVSMTVLLLYAVMTGNSVSAKRAVIMCIVSMGADVLGRSYDVLSALSLSAILLVIENVFIIYNTGFQLSFGAIIGISVVYPAFAKIFVEPLDKKADRLDRKRQIGRRQMLKMLVIILGNLFGSVSVSLVTLPVIMYQYYQVPVYSVFLNIVVIPLMSLLLLCALLVAVVGAFNMYIAVFLMGTVHYILKLYTFLCGVFDNLSGNIWVTGRPELMDCIVFYAVLGMFVILVSLNMARLRRGKGRNKLIKNDATVILAAIVGIALVVLIPEREKGLVIRMLDVGQGECIYVQYNGENYLFDGGSTDVNNVGEFRIYPCLRSHGVSCIDYIFISHADTDHISGIVELMDMQDDTFVIKNLVLPDIKYRESQDKYIELIRKANTANINVLYISDGMSYTSSDGRFKLNCIHPGVNYDYVSTNDYSAVYKMEYEDFAMMFTGDVEENGEKEILNANYTEKLDITVLKVAHHGSKYSSNTEFLSKVKPEIALISCGERNSYGHPHKDTLTRLKNVGAKVYITAESGQITIKVEEKTVKTLIR
ncbi:MAG: DNA internalization-related competence protein ComEC/Rec2 [Lachnospira sp.]|nr:DNA internalization-related competence protein ComEC/Rec2 [Lachnospira sp.]